MAKTPKLISYWTEVEKQYLLDNYSSGKAEEIVARLNRSWEAISKYASNQNICRTSQRSLPSVKWAVEELSYLKDNYATATKITILSNIRRSWHAIASKASKLDLRRITIKTRCDRLLENSSLGAYWLGFILSDGHLSKDPWSIKLSLSQTDVRTLEQFSEFISAPLYLYERERNKKIEHYGVVSAKDSINLPAFAEKYDISNRKTYEPPNFSHYASVPDDFFLSLVIGMIDGDGHIEVRGQIELRMHSSWAEFLSMTAKRIYQIQNVLTQAPPTAKVDKEGYVRLKFSKTIVGKFLKKFAKTQNLPILDRKWERISDFTIKDKRTVWQIGIQRILTSCQQRPSQRELLGSFSGMTQLDLNAIINRLGYVISDFSKQ
jgi:hypothetical protein